MIEINIKVMNRSKNRFQNECYYNYHPKHGISMFGKEKITTFKNYKTQNWFFKSIIILVFYKTCGDIGSSVFRFGI